MTFYARLELLGVREIDDPRYVAMHDHLVSRGFRRVIPMNEAAGESGEAGEGEEYVHLPHGTYLYDGEAADAAAVRELALDAVARVHRGVGIVVFAATEVSHAGLMDAAPSDHRHELEHRRDHGSAHP